MDFNEVTTNDDYQRLKDQEALKDRRENIQGLEQDFNNMIAPGEQTKPPAQPQPSEQAQQPEATPEQPTPEQPQTQDPRQEMLDKLAAQNANPIQELGTAIVGGGIDAVESIGGTVKHLSKARCLTMTLSQPGFRFRMTKSL